MYMKQNLDMIREHAKLINKSVFPGIQGGPLMHIIAAKAVCLKEALSDEVQMAWMYVLGGNAAFELEPWFISTSAANLKEGQKNLWEKYKKKLSDVKVGEYNILLQEYGDKAGYRVYLTECEMTVQEPNDTREWNEVTGIILGEFKRG